MSGLSSTRQIGDFNPFILVRQILWLLCVHGLPLEWANARFSNTGSSQIRRYIHEKFS